MSAKDVLYVVAEASSKQGAVLVGGASLAIWNQYYSPGEFEENPIYFYPKM